MAETIIGKVECIRVADDFGFVGIREDVTNDFEVFIVWFSPSEPSAFTRVLHSMWLSMLRDAMGTGNRVTIVHDDTSAFINSLEVSNSA